MVVETGLVTRLRKNFRTISKICDPDGTLFNLNLPRLPVDLVDLIETPDE